MAGDVSTSASAVDRHSETLTKARFTMKPAIIRMSVGRRVPSPPRSSEVIAARNGVRALPPSVTSFGNHR